MKRKNIASGAPWENKYGYSRAVRFGNTVEVTGTTSVDENGTVMFEGDAYGQAKFIFEKIAKALAVCDCNMKSVVRTRMFVTDISRADEFGRAHKDVFAEIRPATTMVEVRKLIDEKMLIEIEATAIIS